MLNDQKSDWHSGQPGGDLWSKKNKEHREKGCEKWRSKVRKALEERKQAKREKLHRRDHKSPGE